MEKSESYFLPSLDPRIIKCGYPLPVEPVEPVLQGHNFVSILKIGE
jgi:hypothetical protein